jgi:hypothetical protein
MFVITLRRIVLAHHSMAGVMTTASLISAPPAQ